MIGLSQRPALNLARNHGVIPWKDLCLILTWLHNDDQEADEPCLVIVPRYRGRGFIPVCVALSAAYRYNEPIYLAHAARQFNADLGFEDNISNANKVAEAIHSHLDDLVKMPPSPETAIIVGTADIGFGASKRTVEVIDYEPTRQI